MERLAKTSLQCATKHPVSSALHMKMGEDILYEGLKIA